jgi:hypothetical protein
MVHQEHMRQGIQGPRTVGRLKETDGVLVRDEHIGDGVVLAPRAAQPRRIPSVHNGARRNGQQHPANFRLAVGQAARFAVVENGTARNHYIGMITPTGKVPPPADPIPPLHAVGTPHGRRLSRGHGIEVGIQPAGGRLFEQGAQIAADHSHHDTPAHRPVQPRQFFNDAYLGERIEFRPAILARHRHAEHPRVLQRAHQRGGQATVRLDRVGGIADVGGERLHCLQDTGGIGCVRSLGVHRVTPLTGPGHRHEMQCLRPSGRRADAPGAALDTQGIRRPRPDVQPIRAASVTAAGPRGPRTLRPALCLDTRSGSCRGGGGPHQAQVCCPAPAPHWRVPQASPAICIGW